MEIKEKSINKSANLEDNFKEEFCKVITCNRITNPSFGLFQGTVKDCKGILTTHEQALFEKNGKMLKKLRSILGNLNANIVLLLISRAEYNKKALGEKFKEVPNSRNNSEPHSVVHHWLEVFRNERFVEISPFSEGMERIYQYSQRYPLVLNVMESVCKKNYKESLSRKDMERVPLFFKEILDK